MPYPIPIIIGTTIAAVGSVYCFKKVSQGHSCAAKLINKFVYDPHLAPLIEAFIAQQRAQNYYPISSNPASHQPSSGRSSAFDSRADEKLRRRHAAEMYELDETRILKDERDLPPPPYAVRQRHTSLRPVPPRSTVSGRKATPVVEKAMQQELAEMPDNKALINLDSEVPPAAEVEKSGPEDSREQEEAPAVEPLPLSPNPLRDSGDASELYMPMPQAARPVVPQILQDEALFSPSTVSSVLSSPQLLGTSEIDDDDVISLSGVSNNTASYVDAETYTPRTMSPSEFSFVSSRAISPQDQAFGALGLTQVLSQSSAGWDSETPRSDSEWEVLSDRAR